MTRAKLVAELRAITGPDRELDCAVYNYIAWVDRGEPGRARHTRNIGWKRFEWSTNRWVTLLDYTGSLDHALTLYPKKPARMPTHPRLACIEAIKARKETRR